MGIRQSARRITSGEGITVATLIGSSSGDVVLKMPYSVRKSVGIYNVWCRLLPWCGTCTLDYKLPPSGHAHQARHLV